MHNQQLSEAISGDNVCFNVKVPTSDIKLGHVCGEQVCDPAAESINFTVQMIIFNHPCKIHICYQTVFDCHTAHVDRRHGKKVTEDSEWIQKYDATRR